MVTAADIVLMGKQQRAANKAQGTEALVGGFQSGLQKVHQRAMLAQRHKQAKAVLKQQQAQYIKNFQLANQERRDFALWEQKKLTTDEERLRKEALKILETDGKSAWKPIHYHIMKELTPTQQATLQAKQDLENTGAKLKNDLLRAQTRAVKQDTFNQSLPVQALKGFGNLITKSAAAAAKRGAGSDLTGRNRIIKDAMDAKNRGEPWGEFAMKEIRAEQLGKLQGTVGTPEWRTAQDKRFADGLRGTISKMTLESADPLTMLRAVAGMTSLMSGLSEEAMSIAAPMLEDISNPQKITVIQGTLMKYGELMDREGYTQGADAIADSIIELDKRKALMLKHQSKKEDK